MKLKSGYKDYTADGIYHLGNTVGGNLPGLPIFTTLQPTPAQIEAATEAVDSARKMFGPGRRQALKAAKDSLAELLGEVATNAPQIPSVTDTDLAEIGLPVIKTPTRATNPPGECLGLRLFHGQMPGEVKGRCAALAESIRLYEGQWALDPKRDWLERPGSIRARSSLAGWSGARTSGYGCAPLTPRAPVHGVTRPPSW